MTSNKRAIKINLNTQPFKSNFKVSSRPLCVVMIQFSTLGANMDVTNKIAIGKNGDITENIITKPIWICIIVFTVTLPPIMRDISGMIVKYSRIRIIGTHLNKNGFFVKHAVRYMHPALAIRNKIIGSSGECVINFKSSFA